MTLAEKICSLGFTSLKEFICGTVTGGEIIYLPKDEIRGSLEERLTMKGQLEFESDEVLGVLEKEITMKGDIQADEISGTLESEDTIIGNIECEN